MIDLEESKEALNFIKLCKIKYYNFTPFYNIQNGFIAESGIPLFPLSEEDATPAIKKDREDLRARSVDNIFGPGTLENSLLFGLPVKKAQNSYLTTLDGQRRLVEGEDGSQKPSHKFFFRFFPVKQVYVHKINGIFLDNAFTCAHAVFASRQSFLKTLEWYMTAPPELMGKKVKLTNGDQRLQFMQKMDVFMKAMGSNMKSVWVEAPLLGLYDRDLHRLWNTHVQRELTNVTDDPPSVLLRTYVVLGTCLSCFHSYG